MLIQKRYSYSIYVSVRLIGIGLVFTFGNSIIPDDFMKSIFEIHKYKLMGVFDPEFLTIILSAYVIPRVDTVVQLVRRVGVELIELLIAYVWTQGYTSS